MCFNPQKSIWMCRLENGNHHMSTRESPWRHLYTSCTEKYFSIRFYRSGKEYNYNTGEVWPNVVFFQFKRDIINAWTATKAYSFCKSLQKFAISLNVRKPVSQYGSHMSYMVTKALVRPSLRQCYDLPTTKKQDESQRNRWQIVWLIFGVLGDRTSKFGRSKVDGHVQNSGPAIVHVQSSNLKVIYIGWQIMQICNYWISTTQCTFLKWWYIYMQLYLYSAQSPLTHVPQRHELNKNRHYVCLLLLQCPTALSSHY